MPFDNTKYIFNQKEYGKGRLVLAVIKQYVNDVNPNLDELKNAFPSNLQGSLDVVISSRELSRKRQNSSDSKNRYFTKNDESITCSDGETIFVSREWGIGNINRFIAKAKGLGYEVKVMGENTKTIKELYDEYKKNPHDKWINAYKARCEQLLKYKNKEPGSFDVSLLRDIWEAPNNGIANASPGFMSKAEFDNLLDELPIITSKILQNPSPKTLSEVISWAKDAQDKGKFKSIKWGVINRVFSAANPQGYSTIINEKFVVSLINKLNELYGLGIRPRGNWAELNIGLMKAIKAQGLQNEDVFIVNTFTWKLYVLLVKNESKATMATDDEALVAQGESVCCKNIIYYGPPGTGKTYKLQMLLKNNYTDNEILPDRKIWLSDEVDKLSWHEIIILVLLDYGKPMKVADIVSHEYYKIKAEINERGSNLQQTAWSALQSHAVPDSSTVKYSARREPSVFNKTENSLWFIEDDQKEQLDEYKNLLVLLKAGPKQENIIKRYEFVTFHQSYGYEEFIEGLRPITNSDGDISYEVKPGVFKSVCRRAESDPDNQYAIVIDEINRGNISKIFGELITLVEIDKRAGSDNALTVTLPYSGKPFSVPSNIDIIGTMNTADRSLMHIDVALRRRFDFKEIRTKYELISGDVDGVNLKRMLYAINQRVELLLDRDHILGHALLMNVRSIDDLEHTFKTNIMPLLEEYFFEDWDKINQVLNNNKFIEEQKDAHSIWLGRKDNYTTKSYRINLKALKDVGQYKYIYSGVEPLEFAECDIVTEDD